MIFYTHKTLYNINNYLKKIKLLSIFILKSQIKLLLNLKVCKNYNVNVHCNYCIVCAARKMETQ